MELAAEADRLNEYSLMASTRFANAVSQAVTGVGEWPEAFPVWEDALTWPEWAEMPAIRSHRVTGYDFRIFYFAQPTIISILAVASTRRKPGYWRARVSDY